MPPAAAPPAPPAAANVVALTYDFGPNGATFNPPVPLTLTYNPLSIPAGVTPVVAYYDTTLSTWVPVEGGVVDAATGRITVAVAHFTS